MALKHKTQIEAVPFKERRTKGRLVAFNADIVAEHVPSPAHALQQMLAERTADGFIADPVLRRQALVRFVGAFVLLWGGSAAALVTMLVLAR
ncbi:hypothetical protein ASE00_03365 [Sphingomonas sp. Root710]|uniref:hypothetical protein n=1 Tax=Sphingomonas sp. Root710 TaxID=1736594 RepID=UPI0006FDFD51|nr:hypothetical protein [Sphingomonas sp. Root710]KRB85817.1 hypothetical protein ASE00_03365 [Sphingomonas sp. Root710]